MGTWVLVRGLNRDDPRIQQLRELFREAGAHLPDKYLVRLSGYAPDINDDAASRWIALILYVRQIHTARCQRLDPDENNGNRWRIWHIDTHVVDRPIELSIKLIGVLRLEMDNPVPLKELNVERPWPPDAEETR